ncbi:hypothetical protein LCGC14_0613190 [marine sediment metagenome]|uniref:Uncharacterized protein n=1 Tax=marine sediment metagenome TaxID=412755 RepID=A0A0F9RRF3_9ZZZZ
MSELTKCNYCDYQRLKQIAKRDGARVVLRPGHGKLKGINAYVVPLGKRMPRKIIDTTEEREGDLFHNVYFRAWFMGLSKQCAC